MQRELIALAIASLLVGAAAVAITSIVRALSPFSILTKRPVGCDLCMSFWTCIGIAVALWYLQHDTTWLWTILPAMTISLFLLPRISPPPVQGPPPP